MRGSPWLKFREFYQKSYRPVAERSIAEKAPARLLSARGVEVTLLSSLRGPYALRFHGLSSEILDAPFAVSGWDRKSRFRATTKCRVSGFIQITATDKLSGKDPANMMSVPTPPLARPWRIIAAEITQEQDSRKIMELVRELEQAFDEQEVGQSSVGKRLDSLSASPTSRA